MGSNIAIPATVKVGTRYRAKLYVQKGAAGANASSLTLRAGANSTVSDPSIATFSYGTATAAADNGRFEVDAVFTATGASAAVYVDFNFIHKLSTTGFSNTSYNVLANVSSSTFNSATAGMVLGLSWNPGGGASANVAGIFTQIENY